LDNIEIIWLRRRLH